MGPEPEITDATFPHLPGTAPVCAGLTRLFVALRSHLKGVPGRKVMVTVLRGGQEMAAHVRTDAVLTSTPRIPLISCLCP